MILIFDQVFITNNIFTLLSKPLLPFNNSDYKHIIIITTTIAAAGGEKGIKQHSGVAKFIINEGEKIEKRGGGWGYELNRRQ